jgi:hypothetical protein
MKQEEIDYNPVPPKASYPVYCFTDEALAKFKAEVRRDALLEAAKVNCQRCKNGDKLVSKQGKYYLHRIDVESSNDYVDVNCDSEEIHQLIADEQGE